MNFHISRVGRSVIAGLVINFISLTAFAADPLIFENEKGAIGGTDPVAYFSLNPGDHAVPGTDEFTHEWNGATWKFSNAENRDTFAANPEAYAPQFGGYCAFAVSKNFTKPGEPDIWEIVNGKLYMNFNHMAQEKWVAEKDASIVSANANWPAVLKVCEESNNCLGQ